MSKQMNKQIKRRKLFGFHALKNKEEEREGLGDIKAWNKKQEQQRRKKKEEEREEEKEEKVCEKKKRKNKVRRGGRKRSR